MLLTRQAAVVHLSGIFPAADDRAFPGDSNIRTSNRLSEHLLSLMLSNSCLAANHLFERSYESGHMQDDGLGKARHASATPPGPNAATPNPRPRYRTARAADTGPHHSPPQRGGLRQSDRGVAGQAVPHASPHCTTVIGTATQNRASRRPCPRRFHIAGGAADRKNGNYETVMTSYIPKR